MAKYMQKLTKLKKPIIHRKKEAREKNSKRHGDIPKDVDDGVCHFLYQDDQTFHEFSHISLKFILHYFFMI
ncbi:hypothetical protein D478_00870 [Brevibacillus agri BAB-2500]|nr:hypothetical protein D478_00870 [Brevibacillus agri BAB-2500]